MSRRCLPTCTLYLYNHIIDKTTCPEMVMAYVHNQFQRPCTFVHISATTQYGTTKYVDISNGNKSMPRGISKAARLSDKSSSPVYIL